MFTGIIQNLARIHALSSLKLALDQPSGVTDWEIGESIAVNGVCLTVVSFENTLDFDLSEETLKRTSLGLLKAGDSVNFERAMTPAQRFGGHIVQGHVDCLGQVSSVTEHEGSTEIKFSVQPEYQKYLVDKGSISLDGISLTVVEPNGPEFSVWVIPHTLANTNLGSAQAGKSVNIEIDIIARYVEKLLAANLK